MNGGTDHTRFASAPVDRTVLPPDHPLDIVAWPGDWCARCDLHVMHPSQRPPPLYRVVPYRTPEWYELWKGL